ncbi:MAG TPA: septum site-determining protein Ssd [Candidatus Limnocylindrales bacterium]|nr:septum site-determining protein Ssd [Candidatus Limnocylindrales bacterium]
MRRTQTKKTVRPLIATGDPDLLDALLRLASMAGVEPEVVTDLPTARKRYLAASLVILGPDIVPEGVPVRLPRRSGVVIASRIYNDTLAWDLAYDVGAEHVTSLPSGQSWLIERLAQAERVGPGKGRVVTVVGGRGGAGASVLAAGLCVTAVREGYRTLLVDADPLGGGADLLFGWEQEHGLRWGQLTETGGGLDSQTMVKALPNRGDLVLLSCDRDEGDVDPVAALPADLMQTTLEAGRDGRDLVVVDLPRRFDEASECALRAADRALLVVTPELRATAAAARVAVAARALRPELSLVVRDVAGGRLSAASIAKTLSLPLAGRIRSESRLAEALERGSPPASDARSPLATCCKQLIEAAMA